ncbi:MAG TPA: hypothetical protein VIR79_01565 [Nitrospira sp.]
MATASGQMVIIDVAGPFREPREAVFSYDYSIQRQNWATPNGVRVKVGIPEELDAVREKILGSVTGSPGQQLLISQLLSRRIADEKLRIWDADGRLLERRDVIIDPFAGPLGHFFARIDEWVERERETIRAEIKKRTNL